MTDLESYVVDTIHLCSVAVPDAFFGLPGGPVTLTFSGIPHEIRFIDLSLATGQPLVLKYIEIFVKRGGKLLNIAPRAEIAVSSIWPKTERLVEAKSFLSQHSGAYGFHTAKKAPAAARVTLPAPRMVEWINIVNSDGRTARRAAPLQVAVSADGESWTALRTGREHERLGALLAERRRRSCDLPTPGRYSGILLLPSTRGVQ